MMDGAAAVLALWNDVSPEREAAYEAWHAQEHVPERLTVPGMLWARRYGHARPERLPRYLTLYGLRDAGVLDSAPYRRLLREPTPASAAMRPALQHVSRWVCELVDAAGSLGGAGLAVWTSLPDAASACETLAAIDARDRAVAGHLLGRRRHDAAPLPWLAAPQEGGVQGDWLLCVAFAADGVPAQAPPGAVIYRGLPVGG